MSPVIKFGSFKYMKDLYKNGIIYFNPISVFKEYNDTFRGDKNECTIKAVQASKAKIVHEYNDEIFTIDESNGLRNQVIVSSTEMYLNKLLYCLYIIKNIKNDKDKYIDDKVLKFGKVAVYIYDQTEFFNRIVNEVRKQKIPLVGKEIQYTDINDYNGNWSVFKKTKDYEYQNEYRFCIAAKENKPLALRIGSIEDISYLLHSKELNSKIRIN